MTLMFIGRPNEDPATAAAWFYRTIVPGIVQDLAEPEHDGEDILIVFRPNANEDEHRAWRLAAIQSLARKAAPVRVNAIVSSGNGDPLIAASRYFAKAPGVTGQVLALDGKRWKPR